MLLEHKTDDLKNHVRWFQIYFQTLAPHTGAKHFEEKEPKELGSASLQCLLEDIRSLDVAIMNTPMPVDRLKSS